MRGIHTVEIMVSDDCYGLLDLSLDSPSSGSINGSENKRQEDEGEW